MPRRLVIELTPSRGEAAVVRGGRVEKAHAVRFDPGDWAEQWPAALLRRGGVIAEMVRQLGGEGLEASLIVHSPSGVVTVHSCPASAGQEGACGAAELAVVGMAPASVVLGEVETRPLFRDREGGAEHAPQRWTLAAAEAESTLEALESVARGCGARSPVVIPGDALAAAAAIAELRAARPQEEASAVLWMGEDRSVFAAGNGARLRFARMISLGTESLVEALCRAPAGAGSAQGAFSRDQAREFLIRAGIPQRDDVIDAERGLKGASVLPLIQPVLQRLSVEIKQSLRFGLTEAERQKVRLRIAGPGASVRHLSRVLAAQALGGPDQVHEDGAAPAVDRLSTENGLIAALLEMAAPPVTVWRRSHREEVVARRARKALRVGLAAAGMIVCADAALTALDLAEMKARPATSGVPTDLPEKLAAARQASDALSAQVTSRTLAQPPWAPLLSHIARTAPEHVRVSGISFDTREGGAGMTLSGFVDAAGHAQPAPALLTRFLQDLAQTPLLGDLQLRQAARSDQQDASSSQQFRTHAPVISVPSMSADRLPAGDTAAAEPGGEP
ncbi:MAG: hypothetical protein SFZ24_09620 [Planctomycetota bacterium]|nr:hypothetical protein [Planctomycetota bacterium]